MCIWWARSGPDRVAPYLRELHANFNFDLALSLAEVVRQENDTEDLIELLDYVQGTYKRVTPYFINALILFCRTTIRSGLAARCGSIRDTST